MSKLAFDKYSVICAILAFVVTLIVLTVASLSASDSLSLLSGNVFQAAIVAICLGVGYALIQGHRQAKDPNGGASIQLGAVHRTDIDPLTHLLNQRGLTVKLLELMALGERYGNNIALAIIGVDHLDEVVEKHNQTTADAGMVAIANEMMDCLRMPDVLGRWESDQFIAILPETQLDGARHIGERLREAVSRSEFETKKGEVLTLTASIGVTVFRMGDDLQSVLGRATRAMNAARSQGCNCVLTDLAA